QPFPITPETNGDHRFPDVVSWGGYDCAALPTSSIAGATTHCRNCLAGSDPAACGGRGCNVERISDGLGTLRWRCVGGCPVAASCAPPTVMIGFDSACGIVCSTNWCDPNPCLNGGVCALSGNGFVCICPPNCTGTLC